MGNGNRFVLAQLGGTTVLPTTVLEPIHGPKAIVERRPSKELTLPGAQTFQTTILKKRNFDLRLAG